MRYFYVRRIIKGEDCGIVDIPERDLEVTLKRHKEWINEGEVGAIKEEVKDETDFICPICDKVFKTEITLKMHKGRFHKASKSFA
jgi:ssDNA-binding Zn-finger/Zn-ribbon topoisomerase 1